MSIFQRIQLKNWRQFAEVGIEFHPRLTILTGANGAGKTTILHLLNRHWGWNIQYVSTPRFSKRGTRKYWAGFWSDDSPSSEPAEPDNQHQIGQIDYGDHGPAQLSVQRDVTETFAVQINPQPTLAGVYVPSHRPLYIHQPVKEIPTNVNARQQIFDVYLNTIRNRWALNQKVTSPSYMIKQSLISLATFGYGNEAIVPNAEARRTFEGFQKILGIVLPETLGYHRIQIRAPDVILETATGDIAFDAVSGGISALIDIAWQVFLYSTIKTEFVVAIDEPEAHLHPALQRSVLPKLLAAFPQVQFIVATHNPLVAGSAKDSSVYVLHYDENRRVHSQLLDQINKAGTANELLRDALGLESTSGMWVDDTVDTILTRYKGRELTQDLLENLRKELNALGLSRFLPDTINRLEE